MEPSSAWNYANPNGRIFQFQEKQDTFWQEETPGWLTEIDMFEIGGKAKRIAG
jgi:hypothetical protein